MRRLIYTLIALLVLASSAFAGTVYPSNDLSPAKPLLPMNYIGSANNLSPDLLDRLALYVSFEQAGYDGTTDEVIDSSGEGNHCTMQGGGTLATGAGKLGQGFLANGTNYFTCPLTVINQNAGGVGMWMKSNASLTAGDARFLGTNHTAGTAREWRTSVDGVTSAHALNVSNEAGSLSTVFLPTTFATDTYVLVFWTWKYDGSTNTIWTGYLNNVAGTPVTMTGKVSVPDVDVVLGEWNGTVLPSPAGFDEPLIYKRVPSEAERTLYFNNTRGRYIQ